MSVMIAAICGLAACVQAPNYAPVAEVSGYEAIPKSGIYRVGQGDTLYSIAWRYGLDYRVLAQRNQINPPYAIQLSQVILLRANRTSRRVSVPSPAAVKEEAAPLTHSPLKRWVWPVRGRVIETYSLRNKGINITGRRGQDVYAANAGKVVYAGDGLRGYGNLIILKHNSLYLSAYAHNAQIFVREGQWVKQGQAIAAMGDSGTDRIMLHFEVRYAGKPINPLSLLSS